MDSEFDVQNSFGFDQQQYTDADNSNVFGLDGVDGQDHLQAPAADNEDIFAAVSSSTPTHTENIVPLGVPDSVTSAKAALDAQRKERLEKKAAAQKENFQQQLKLATDDLQSFQQKRQEKIAKTKQTNSLEQKQQLQDTADTLQNGRTWEKVAKYSDLKPKHDVKATQQPNNNERMRELMIDLKNDVKAP